MHVNKRDAVKIILQNNKIQYLEQSHQTVRYLAQLDAGQILI
jgi:hypothetical protein